jgi:hypothetical protein
MKHFSVLLLAMFVAALAQAQTPASDMKMLVGRSAVVQRMPFYQPGTYNQISKAYAGQTATIIEVKPSTMFAMMPTLTASQMMDLPPLLQQTTANIKTASTIVVQFADGTKADTGAMPVMASNLSTYLELLPDKNPSAAVSSPTVITPNSSPPMMTVTTAADRQAQTRQFCPIQPTKVKYASMGISILAGLAGMPNGVPIAEVHWINQSTQEVHAVRLNIQYFDVVDSPTYTQEVAVQQKTKPTKKGGGVAAAWLGTQNTHLASYIDRVKFKDGSIWNDDGSHSCSVDSVGK